MRVLSFLLLVTLAAVSAKSPLNGALDTFIKLYKEETNISCDEAIDNLLLDLPNMGSIFYAIINGKYLGVWGDYTSCKLDATNGTYVLVTVDGKYIGPGPFTRGGAGYKTPLSSRVGMCVPQQCTEQDMKKLDASFIS